MALPHSDHSLPRPSVQRRQRPDEVRVQLDDARGSDEHSQALVVCLVGVARGRGFPE